MFRDDHGRELVIGSQPLERGGDGEIWSVENRPRVVFKKYHRPEKLADRAKKVAFMCQHPPALRSGESRQALAWPENAVLENGQFVGFTMINATDCIPMIALTGQKLRIGKDQQSQVWTAFERQQPQGLANRLLLCYNLCLALQLLHRGDQYVHGDLKPKNVLVSSQGYVRIIDIDSIQICQGKRVQYPALVCTQGYRPAAYRKIPKGHLSRARLQASWDWFGFAVICYELLVGIHPFMASHPKAKNFDQAIELRLFVHGQRTAEFDTIPDVHQAFGQLPAALQTLFQQGFGLGRINPSDWRQTLETEIMARQPQRRPPTKRKSSLMVPQPVDNAPLSTPFGANWQTEPITLKDTFS